MMKIAILSLFPEYFRGPFDESILKQARKKGILEISLVDVRDFADNRHQKVDDRPYGGGPGMVLMAPPVINAIRSVKLPGSHIVYLSPQGNLLTASKCRQLAAHENLILLCGHYEGIDQRIVENEVDEEISIGDYVLTNGCLAAIVLVDALVRFVPGVLGHESAASEDSFEKGIFDCPHYTRPQIFEGESVPEVLLSGNHKQIAEWRKEKALEKTQSMRPDLFEECRRIIR
jgi:tRNA (guanine37-N1)-methyltransferase